MSTYKKLLFLSIMLLSTGLHGADILWTGSPNPVPNDGNTYYINTDVTISVDLTISGTLEIRDGGNLTVDSGTTTINNTVSVKSGGKFRIETTLTSTGYLNVYDGGDCRIRTGATVTNGASGKTGIINVYGGFFVINDVVQNGNGNAQFNVYGGSIYIYSSGILTISDPSYTSVISQVNVYGGNLDIRGGEIRSNLHSSSTGGIYVRGGRFNFINGACYIGYTDSTHGDLHIYSGSCNVNNGTLYLGSETNTTANTAVYGGLFKVDGGSVVAGDKSGTTSTFNVNGGTLSLESGTFTNADDAASTATISVTNGAFELGTGTLTQGSGSSTITIFGVSVTSPITSGAWTLGGGDVLTIPQGSALSILYGGNIDNNGTITNNNLVVRHPGGTFDNTGGTFNNNGVFMDMQDPDRTVDFDKPTTIPSGLNINVPVGCNANITADFTNLSEHSIYISGDTYVYGRVNNGSASVPGTVHINYPGNIFMLGGTISNTHANSKIYVNPGGSLNNYYGEIDLTIGGLSSLDVSNGGKVYVARGNSLGAFTMDPAASFFDETYINLQDSLTIDQTWTITDKAVIKGNGYTINFGPNGAIKLIGPDASIMLDDILLDNVSGNKIQCTDANGTLSIHNVIWTQDANFDYTWGKIYVKGDWLIDGNLTAFNLESDHGLTVTKDSTIHLKQATLQYNANTNNKISMFDKTSQIHLERAKILASKPCNLSNGTLLVTAHGILQGDAALNIQNLSDIDVLGSLQRIGTVIL